MSIYVIVTIELQIYDPEAFAAAARLRAERDGLSREDIESYTTDDLNECALMLFDPGASPPGCSINSSFANEPEVEEE